MTCCRHPWDLFPQRLLFKKINKPFVLIGSKHPVSSNSHNCYETTTTLTSLVGFITYGSFPLPGRPKSLDASKYQRPFFLKVTIRINAVSCVASCYCQRKYLMAWTQNHKPIPLQLPQEQCSNIARTAST